MELRSDSNEISREVIGTGASQDMTVYGKVFKNQKDAAAGSYTDTVTIGVHY